MTTNRSICPALALASMAALSLSACASAPATSAETAASTADMAGIPAGTYALDPAHGKITWSVSHLGFSTYTGQFPAVNATLQLDPQALENTKVTATIDLTQQGANNDQLNKHLKSADFFDVANHPEARFATTGVTVVDGDSATVDGNLTLRGVTRPVRFTTNFNKAGVNPLDKKYTLGFDGYATIKRSDFGVSYALPAVSDEVQLHLEGEFKLQKEG